jgi:FkbM family methyltransferase
MQWLGITRRVTCHELALGDGAGAVTMTMPLIQGVRMQGLTHVQDESIEGYAASAMTFTVPLARLDDLDWLRDQPVAAIKLDVENYEQFVLRGAEALIRRCQPLIYCELWDNENRQICLKIMQEHGYRVQVLDRGRLRTFLPGTDTHHNFFFVPEKKA